METRWMYVNSKDFPALREASNKTCVIPVGSIEKHGLHLPLGTDMLHPSALVYEASKLETVTVAPDFWFGDVPGAQPEGSMTFDMAVVTDLMENLCDQIGAQGYNKILLVNGHGGNGTWLHSLQRRLENKKKPYAVLRGGASYPVPNEVAKALENGEREKFPELTDEDCEILLRWRREKLLTGHGCFSETAYLMAICPEKVHMEYLGIEDGHSTGRSVYLREAGIQLVDGGWEIDYPNFYAAEDPYECNERMAAVAMRLGTERLAKAFKLLKEDENILKWHNERIAKINF